jgi:hypothetical protein
MPSRRGHCHANFFCDRPHGGATVVRSNVCSPGALTVAGLPRNRASLSNKKTHKGRRRNTELSTSTTMAPPYGEPDWATPGDTSTTTTQNAGTSGGINVPVTRNSNAAEGRCDRGLGPVSFFGKSSRWTFELSTFPFWLLFHTKADCSGNAELQLSF